MSKPDSYETNVFINCPFDDKYFDLLQTLLFTVVYYGFTPGISLESSDSGKPRLEKIIELIRESKYSIHDISRLQSKAANEYYRLNMPFELGIDFGLRKFVPEFSDKRSLILETKRYDYMKAISDINGLDIKSHDDVPVNLIKCVRAWFLETANFTDLNASEKAFSDFIEFNKNLFQKKLKKYLSEHSITDAERFAGKEIDEMPIPEYIHEAKQWLSEKIDA